MATNGSSQTGGFLRSRSGLALLVFLAVAGFFIITEHTAHLFGVLPFALLLLCPLMHLFMHGGHGSNGGQAGHAGHDGDPAQRSEGGSR